MHFSDEIISQGLISYELEKNWTEVIANSEVLFFTNSSENSFQTTPPSIVW